MPRIYRLRGRRRKRPYYNKYKVGDLVTYVDSRDVVFVIVDAHYERYDIAFLDNQNMRYLDVPQIELQWSRCEKEARR